MKKILFLLFIEILLSSGSSNTEVTGAEEYIKTISGFTSEKAIVTDNGMLIIVIDAVSDKGYDYLACQFLDEAKREGAYLGQRIFGSTDFPSWQAFF